MTKALLCLGLFLIAGCAAKGTQSSVVVAPNPTRTPRVEFAQVSPARPVTLTLADFKFLRKGIRRGEVVKRVGQPNESGGSGLYIDVYYLKDGTAMVLGGGGTLLYAHVVDDKGTRRTLIKG